MNKILKFVLDLIFPIYCVECKKEGEWLCGYCVLRYENFKIHEKRNLGELTYIDSIFYFYDFDDNNISKLIHVLKYDYAYDVARFLAKVIHNNFVDFVSGFDNLIFVPAPLHSKRLNERGFNQSIIILEKLQNEKRKTEMGDMEIVDLLKRVRNTGHQAGLSGVERGNNLENAFILNNEFSINDFKDCNIVLFDDVVTTGNTLDKCAKVLRENGFRNKIIGLSIAGQD